MPTKGCRMPLFGRLALLCLPAVAAEWVLVNIIRHGERYDDKLNTHLHPYGKQRAEYIAKCVMNPAPTLAFPLGPPDQLLASVRSTSTRPKETLEDLATAAGITIDNHIHYKDVGTFAKYVAKLKHGQTLFVAWQHKWIARLIESQDHGGLAPRKWPKKCGYHEWDEPEEIQGGACYDVIWQLALYRHNDSFPWRAQAFSQMHMGFAGSASMNCTQAFRPHSNPDHWNHLFRGEAAAHPVPFDCRAGLFNWKRGWSEAKVAWCCAHAGVACEVGAAELPGAPMAPPPAWGGLLVSWLLGVACAWPLRLAACKALGRSMPRSSGTLPLLQ